MKTEKLYGINLDLNFFFLIKIFQKFEKIISLDLGFKHK